MASGSNLEQEIGQLADLSRVELVERWHRIYRCPPPRGIKRGLLERAIAWHLQARHFGGLSPSTRRRLAEAAAGSGALGGSAIGKAGASFPSNAPAASVRQPVIPTASLTPGSRLIREWHGRGHSVDVIEGGFVFEGRSYTSLSAIAREITGARWSGPRFFGL